MQHCLKTLKNLFLQSCPTLPSNRKKIDNDDVTARNRKIVEKLPFWSTWDKTILTRKARWMEQSVCFSLFFRINTSIQLRSSLITINSQQNDFSIGRKAVGVVDWKENLFHFESSSPCFNFFWAYKLGKSLHYIRFIWCGCCMYKRWGITTQLCSNSMRKKSGEKFFFFSASPPPSLAFIFLIKLIRKEAGK
jgi:hypothetical protein